MILIEDSKSWRCEQLVRAALTPDGSGRARALIHGGGKAAPVRLKFIYSLHKTVNVKENKTRARQPRKGRRRSVAGNPGEAGVTFSH